MTAEEAKNIIENAVYNYRPIGDSMTAFSMAIEALEKQIPKKVHSDGMRIPFSYYCADCGEEISDDGYRDTSIKFCWNCGKRIGWSEVE